MKAFAGRNDAAAGAVPSSEPVPYHCVCGETTELDLRTGGRCEACGRRYSAEVARLAAVETIRMPIGFEEPIDAPKEAPLRLCGTAPRGALDGPLAAEKEPGGPGELSEPLRYGHFRVMGQLGRGGMGDVYRALDESLQRYVALKVIRTNDEEGPTCAAPLRLLQEARAQARVNHPGVVHIYYVSQDPARPFLAMELVAGRSLADRLREGPIPYGQTVNIALQIARALRHAARYDVVHGDIKPGNILMAGDGGVKLSDFGLARRLSRPGEGPHGPITGTPHYLPPEIVDGAEPDIRSDMYALGVMLFEMTFGRRPYSVETGLLRDHIEAHRSAAPEFPEPWPATLPEGWRDVLGRLLEKDPAGRYQTHDELIAALEKLRPVDLPKAGRVIRGLAWIVDLFLASATGALLLAPLAFLSARGMLPESPLVVAPLFAAASALVVLAATWLQAWWKTSPGKALFQLRIVDRFGLTPTRGILAARAPIQLLPVWGQDLGGILEGFGAEGLGTYLITGVLAVAFVDAAPALFRADGRTLHDLLLKTKVVLDTRMEKETA